MIPYSLHVAFLIVISLIFYKLMLKKETYYKLNRMVLLACLTLSFILPFVSVPQKFSFIKESPVELPVVKPVTNAELPAQFFTDRKLALQQQAVETQSVNYPGTSIGDKLNIANVITWAFWLYWCGVFVFGVNLLVQIVVVLYKIYKSPVIHDGNYRIIELDDDKAPCSFGNYIFINPAKYDWDVYNQILIHEKVHIQQQHTIDLIIAELMLALQWFNPFAWLYRKEIENNLEFLTDHTVVDQYEVDQADYQLNLLKVSVPNFSMRITTNYNQSLLKQRIIMMNSKRSNVHIIWKYFAMIPLFICMICLLNKPVAIAQQQPVAVKKVNKVRKADKKIVTTQKSKVIQKVSKQPSGLHLTTKIDSTYVSNYTGAIGNIESTIIKDGMQITNVTYRNFTANEIITLQEHGVTAGYAKTIASIYEKFTIEDIINLQEHGVTAGYVQGVGASGYKNFTANDIIDLQQHGVTSGYVQGVGASGFKNFKADNIIDLQQHGITSGYIQGIGASGFKNFKTDNIIDLQQHGITSGYIQGIGASGYINYTADNIIDLQQHGITSGYIQGVAAAGYKNYTADNIIDLQQHGITSGYLQGIGAAGYRNFTVDHIIDLQQHGVTSGYVQSVGAAGYKNFTADDIIRLKQSEVTPGYTKGLSNK